MNFDISNIFILLDRTNFNSFQFWQLLSYTLIFIGLSFWYQIYCTSSKRVFLHSTIHFSMSEISEIRRILVFVHIFVKSPWKSMIDYRYWLNWNIISRLIPITRWWISAIILGILLLRATSSVNRILILKLISWLSKLLFPGLIILEHSDRKLLTCLMSKRVKII